MKVLVIQQRYGVGDMVIFIPYFQALSEKIGCPLTVLAKKSSRATDIFKDDKHVDSIINLDKSIDGLRGFFKLSSELKKWKFDKVFIYNGSLRYYLLAKLSGIREIYQYPLFTSKDVIFQTAKVFTEGYLNKVISTQPKIILNQDKVENTFKNLNFNNEYKHIVLGISASGPTKRWGINNFLKLAKKISSEVKCKFYVAGGQQDEILINKFLSSEIKNDCISLSNLSIEKILPIIKNCNFYIGNDTGFLHLSSGLGLKCIGLFFDSPAFSYSAYSDNIKVIVPEGETLLSTSHNTLGKDRISFEKVLAEAKKILN